ncbi:RNA polymerase sigma factor [Paenibacillus lupini]|uniref:RNA polymerase sigma factor n=1 Tax=Paenibacillus lupini TaxID=1450204 RepID=UPI00142346CF|nr:RNA polymerase sigma factor [Paenibacillus lupini]NIK21449.1 RNA polymerase sigma-70 factor (ECF subfamily) [Paenibacillus lupini]
MESIQREFAERIEEWVEEVQKGESEQYRAIVLHFQRRIHLYCFHMLGNPSEAEDAVQEVFLKAYTSIATYKPIISFSAWLYRIAHNHCLNLIKQRKKRLQLYNIIVRLQVHEPASHAANLVEELLESLSVHDRQLVILKVIEERSFAEISEITGDKEATLRKQFERLRKKIVRSSDWNRKELLDENQAICTES